MSPAGKRDQRRAPGSINDVSVKADDAWKALSEVAGWIRHLDAKAVAVLAFSGAIGAILSLAVRTSSNWHIVTTWFGLAAAASLTIAVCFACWCVKPRLELGKKSRGAENLFFYRYAAQTYPADRNDPDFVKEFNSLVRDPAEVITSVAKQMHSYSLIASRKAKWAGWAVIFLGAGAVFSTATILCLVFAR